MTAELALLSCLIALGAAWLFVHVALLLRVLRVRALSVPLRVLALVPPATPVLGWIAGARVLAVLWVALAVLYVTLRSLA